MTVSAFGVSFPFLSVTLVERTGFGGDNEISGNLMFNSCRESGDHGVVNSWDREVCDNLHIENCLSKARRSLGFLDRCLGKAVIRSNSNPHPFKHDDCQLRCISSKACVSCRHSSVVSRCLSFQAIDNDDGSSWYHTSDNLFYSADGFKMGKDN